MNLICQETSKDLDIMTRLQIGQTHSAVFVGLVDSQRDLRKCNVPEDVSDP